MNYLILILIIIVLGLLAWHRINYLKATGGTEAFAKRSATYYLFAGFISVTGFTSLFAPAIFEAIGLNKPEQFEWMAFGAYFIFALSTVLIMRKDSQKKLLHCGHSKAQRNWE